MQVSTKLSLQAFIPTAVYNTICFFMLYKKERLVRRELGSNLGLL